MNITIQIVEQQDSPHIYIKNKKQKAKKKKRKNFDQDRSIHYRKHSSHKSK